MKNIKSKRGAMRRYNAIINKCLKTVKADCLLVWIFLLSPHYGPKGITK